MKRAALVAGVSVTALICAFTVHAAAAPAATQSSFSRFGFFRQRALEQPVRPLEKKSKYLDNKPAKAALHETDKIPPIPKGPLHIIVSIDKQRATLYADGQLVAQTKISSGTATHPTPMGVFSILQKNRHHVSNLYDAKMPYMQRITWSGAALHEGPLPGYPASHGCVRLPNEFAQLLWKVTKIGARVIIARDEPAPVEISHGRLFVAKARTEEPKVEPKPDIKHKSEPEVRREPVPEAKPAAKLELKPEPKLEIISERKAVPARSGETIETRAAMAMIKTADATGTLRGPISPDAPVKPLVPGTARNTAAGEQPTKLPLHGDVDEIAMPAAPATTGAMAVTARPAPVVAERPAPVVAERRATVAPMAKSEVIKQDRIEPTVAAPAPQPAAAEAPVPAAPAAAAAEPPRRKGTVSVFISLKENRVYVRQNMEPLFDAPVTVAQPGQPIGTHVYTAMGAKPDGSMRWTVVSIPSAYKPAPELKTADAGRKPRNEGAVKTSEERLQVPSASAALDRIVMPQDTVERIASLITPGASLIVSDNKLSGETGATTDFIVETKKISDTADGLTRHQPRRLAPRQYY